MTSPKGEPHRLGLDSPHPPTGLTGARPPPPHTQMREQQHSGEKQETDAHALFAFLHRGMGCRTLQMLLLCSPARRTDVGWSHRQVFSNSNMDATLELYGKPAVAQLSLGEAGCVKRPWTRRRHLASPDAREPRPSTPRAIRAQGPQPSSIVIKDPGAG